MTVITKILPPTFGMIASNPRYFRNSTGKAIYITGSHTWTVLQDSAAGTFDYSAYLAWMETNHFNFFRMWTTDSTSPYTTAYPSVVGPFKYPRPGPGLGADGILKYDVSQFNQAYFDRMRSRIIQAGNRNIYVSVQLFNAWGDVQQGNVVMWTSHPYNSANNINGINGDPNATGDGGSVQNASLTFNSAVFALQKAYVQKVIDTVDDLQNIMYEINNEGAITTTDWQYSIIDYIHRNQKKHTPVGMTAFYGYNNFPTSEAKLEASQADWISPTSGDNGANEDTNPKIADGSQVRLFDTDHIFGFGGDCQLVWREFLRGNNFILMDDLNGIGITGSNPLGSSLASPRLGMVETVLYAARLNLDKCVPSGSLVPSGYCLANPNGTQYILLSLAAATVTVNLSAAAGITLHIEWLDINANTVVSSGTVVGGSSSQSFTTQTNDSILFLFQ